MGKNLKTKSILACAVLASVLGGSFFASAVEAAWVNALVGPKDFASLRGKQTVFGQKRGYVENQQLNTYDPKPTWQIVDANTGGVVLLAMESWGKNRVSDTGIYDEKLYPDGKIQQYYYTEVLKYFEDSNSYIFSDEERSLLEKHKIVELKRTGTTSDKTEYESFFTLPSSGTLNLLTATQKKRGEAYWLSDCEFRSKHRKSQGYVYGSDIWYDQGSIDVNGNYQVVNGAEVKAYYPMVNIVKELVFAYYSDKLGTKRPYFFKSEERDPDSVIFTFRDTVNERDVSIDNLVVTGNQIQFSADNLATGEDQGLSGILEDSNGSYVSYARLVDELNNSRIDNVQISYDSSSFVKSNESFPFPPGEYILYLFNEKCLSRHYSRQKFIDYAGNFYNLGKIVLDGNGVIEGLSISCGSNIPNLSVDKIKELSISGDSTFTNLSIGSGVDFVHSAKNIRGNLIGSYYTVDCETLTVTNKLNWTGVLDAEGTIELKGIFSMNGDTLTLVRPTNTNPDWNQGISGWNDIVYNGAAEQNAVLHVNGNMHGLTVNGGTFIAEKNLTLADYLQVNNGATAIINGNLQAANVLLSENGKVELGNGKTISLSNGLTMYGGSSISDNGGTGILQFNNANFVANGAVSFNNMNFAGTIRNANLENTTIQISGAGNKTMVSENVNTKGSVEISDINLETNNLSVDGTLNLSGNLTVKKVLDVQNDKADNIIVNNLIFGEGINTAGRYYFDLRKENLTVTGKATGTVKLNFNYVGSLQDNTKIDVFTGTGDLTGLNIQPVRITDKTTKDTYLLTQDTAAPGKMNVNISKHNTAVIFADRVVAGQKVYFGNYWQSDTNGDGKVDKTDDKQKILWDVVANENGVTTLFSEKVIQKSGKEKTEVSVTGNVGNSEEDAIRSFKGNFIYSDVKGVWLRDAFSEAEAKFFDYELDIPTLEQVQDGGTFNLTAEQRRASSTGYADTSVYGLANAYEETKLGWFKMFYLRQINNNGNVFNKISTSTGIRPVMNFNGSKSVLFATNAENGKGSVGAGGYTRLKSVEDDSTLELTFDDAYVHSYTGQERKTGDISIDRIMLNANSVQLRYTGAKYVDDNSYISYFVGDGNLSQDYLGYGKSEVVDKSGNGFAVVRLKDITDANDTNGYALTLFNEYDKGTSMAGALNIVPGSFTLDSNGNTNYTIKGNATLPNLIVGIFSKFTATDGILTITDKLTINGIAEVDKIRFAKGSTLVGSKSVFGEANGVLTVSEMPSKEELQGINIRVENLSTNDPTVVIKVKQAPLQAPLLLANGPLLGGTNDNSDLFDSISLLNYGAVIDPEHSEYNHEQLTICAVVDPELSEYCDISNIVEASLRHPLGMAWWETFIYDVPDDYWDVVNNAVNTFGNLNSLANVQSGLRTMSSLVTDSIQENAGLRGKDSGLRIEEQRARENVWASYIHSKEKIEGRKTGHLQQNSTLQYNGTVVGADLWKSEHGFGGVALHYADGNFRSYQMVNTVKNEADYYGISVYNRQDVGKFNFICNGGFTYGKNDITVTTVEMEDSTANPRAWACNLGFRVEEPVALSGATTLTPFAGARYTFIKTKDYQNDFGMEYAADNQHLLNIPVGLTLKGTYETKEGWTLGGSLTGGYNWNLGNRNSTQSVSYYGCTDSIGFDVADRGEYFVKAGLTAEHKNLAFELGYRYSKGDTSRDNRWNVNCTWSF